MIDWLLAHLGLAILAYLIVGFGTLGVGIFLRWPEVHTRHGVLICLLVWVIPLGALLGTGALGLVHRAALWCFDPDRGPLALAVHFAQRVWNKPTLPPPPPPGA